MNNSVLPILVFLLTMPFPLLAEKGEKCVLAEAAIKSASEIRGLEQKQEVPCFVQSKEQVRKYILRAIDEKVPAEKFKHEELVFKTIGLLPPEFSYREGLVELYLSQIGGYYEPEEEYFAMAGWMPAMLQSTIAVHELTHALQDQYFAIDKLLDHKTETTDRLLARSALIEGDATAVMMDFLKKQQGQPPLEEAENVGAAMMQNVIGASFVAGMSGVPQSLQYILLFPYTSGLRFAHHLLKQGGYSEIDKAFRNLPASTEEILHPEQFDTGKQDSVVFTDELIQKLTDREESSVVYRDTLGEFLLSLMLRELLADPGRSAEAAKGWGGDELLLLKEGDGDERSLWWLIQWDSVEDRDEFAALFREGVKAKGLEVEAELLEDPARAVLISSK